MIEGFLIMVGYFGGLGITATGMATMLSARLYWQCRDVNGEKAVTAGLTALVTSILWMVLT